MIRVDPLLAKKPMKRNWSPATLGSEAEVFIVVTARRLVATS